ncbi:hypothetical protein KI387_043262 [Taxus chinensis]|uniref:NYN domain-containing protein n=1 Tax=Taxus chinensis TaxID=29808 RepID=A0AA38F3Z4_TAXCH|nr:hypothetical protein KI387_043262 [Taxus chinensis]
MASHVVNAGMAKGTVSLGMMQLAIKKGGMFSGRYMLGGAAKVKDLSSLKDPYFTHKMGEAGVSRGFCAKYSTIPMEGACVSRVCCIKCSTKHMGEAVVSSGVCAKYSITFMGGAGVSMGGHAKFSITRTGGTCVSTGCCTKYITPPVGGAGFSMGGCAKYSTIPMGGVAEEVGNASFGIFWDAREGCRFPEGFSFADAAHKIQNYMHREGHFEPLSTFIIYGDASDSTLPHSSSVKTEDSFEIEIVVEKDLDTKPLWIENSILTDMFMFALDNPAPSRILIVSDKDDLYPAIEELKKRGYYFIHGMSGKQDM